MEELSKDLEKAYGELRTIDTSITALNERTERFGNIKSRFGDSGARGERLNVERRYFSKKLERNESAFYIESSNKRRLAVSVENEYAIGGKRMRDEPRDSEDKRTIQSLIVMPTIETKSREAAINELKQKEKNEVKIRNKRLFSNLLLGTLQRFQTEEKKVCDKEKIKEKKRMEIDRRLMQSEMEEKEKLKKERMALINQRHQQERLIKSLQRKKAIIQYAEQKQQHFQKLQNFIQTKAKPPIFYLPAKHTLRTLELLKSSGKRIDVLIERRRNQMEAELKSPEEKQSQVDDDSIDVNDGSGQISTVRSTITSNKLRNKEDDENKVASKIVYGDDDGDVDARSVESQVENYEERNIESTGKSIENEGEEVLLDDDQVSDNSG